MSEQPEQEPPIERHPLLPSDVLRAFIDSLDVAVWILDEAGGIRLINPAALALFGITPEQVPPTIAALADLVPHYSTTGRLLSLAETPGGRLLRGEAMTHLPVQIRQPSGRCRVAEASGFVYQDQQGVHWLIGFERDVTEEHEATINREAVIAVARAISRPARLKPVLDTALYQFFAVLQVDYAVIWLFDARRCVLDLVAARGLRPETIASLQQLAADATSPAARVFQTREPLFVADVDRIPPDFEAARHVVAREGIRRFGIVPLRVDEQCLGVIAFGVRGERTFPALSIATIQTIAELFTVAIQNARLQEATREGQEITGKLLDVARTIGNALQLDELLERVADLMPSTVGCDRGGIWLWDEQQQALVLRAMTGVPAAIEPAVRRLLTIRRGQGTLLDVVRATRRPKIVEDAAASPLIMPETIRLLNVRSTAAIPLIRRDAVIGVIAVDYTGGVHRFTDRDLAILSGIADQLAVAIENLRLTEQLRQRVIDLEEERSRRAMFLNVVAHELRGPMTVLGGYADLLARWEESLAERPRLALRSIVEQVHRLNRMVSDLLDVARIETGRLAIERSCCDIVEIARKVVAEQQATTTRHRIRLEAPGVIVGNWDAVRIAQVLTNLLNNAIKYSPNGGDILVRIWRMDHEVAVSVRDCGVGIPADLLPQLFQPYSRLARERPAKGLGLGLYISKGIVEAHGGRIWAESPGPGQGATFTFTLPLEQPPDECPAR